MEFWRSGIEIFDQLTSGISYHGLPKVQDGTFLANHQTNQVIKMDKLNSLKLTWKTSQKENSPSHPQGGYQPTILFHQAETKPLW